MIGRQISHFQVTEKLGEGGMGTVYKALDLDLERPVVLKFLLPNLSTDENAKQRFVQEARAASALDHPNVCTIYEIGEVDGGQVFISMAFYEGETLLQKIMEGPLPVDEALDLTAQVARGLAKAHEREIVHRDIKPANVIVTADGVAKILDFGLAKLSHSPDLTAPGSVVGTLAYMAPEPLMGMPTDHRVDIWSLAAVLYEMITGRPPFQEEYPQALVYSITNESPPPIPDFVKGVPIAVEALIAKGLEKGADDRYRDAREFLAAIEACRAGGGPPAPRAGSTDIAKTVVYEPAAAPASAAGSPSVSAAGAVAPDVGERRPEMAYVLFLDLVGYSQLTLDDQANLVKRLTAVVEETAWYRQAKKSDELIVLPSGDGMALVFLGSMRAPVECAVEIWRALSLRPDIKLRMGAHYGPVLVIEDISKRRNAAGGGINMAQRVMDKGDEGHILVSGAVADVLRQLGDWKDALDDLGVQEVKHGEKLHLFNLHRPGEFGNPETPSKVGPAPAEKPGASKRLGGAAAAVVLIAALAASALGLHCELWSGAPGCAASPAVEPLGLTYWMTVQRTRDGERLDPIRVPGEMIFEAGDLLALYLSNAEAGHLYIVNEGPTPSGGLPQYVSLFPSTTMNQGRALLEAGGEVRIPRRGSFVLDAEQGTEKLWVVWSRAPVARLEAGGLDDETNLGEVRDVETRRELAAYFGAWDPERVNRQRLEDAKQTVLESVDEVLVHLIRLEHL